MMKRSLSTRERTLLVILAILVLFAAYYLLVHRTVVDSLTDIESQKSLTETEITIAQGKVNRLKRMQNELEEIEKSRVKSVVPEYDNLSKEIVFLNKVLEGTTDYTINFSSLTTTEGIARRVANLSFTSSSYNVCCRIIEKLQNCEYCCRLGDVTMEPIKNYRNTAYTTAYDYSSYYYDADYSILRNPLTVNVLMTFYEKVAEN